MAASVRFVVVCILGRRIVVTEEYWQKIITIKHPNMAGHELQVQETLTNPDEVRQSKSDDQVKMYYRRYGNLHLCVVAKHLNGDGFIITTYFTDRIKEGMTVWIKS